MQVVFNNLKRVGIGKYAIPIHNSKNKKEIISEIRESIENSKNYRDTENGQNLINSYKKNKEIIEKYGEVILAKRSPENKNLYEYIGEYFSFANSPDLDFEIYDIEKIDYQFFENIKNNLDGFEESLKVFDFDIKKCIWNGFAKNLTSEEEDKMFRDLNHLEPYLNNFLNEIKISKVFDYNIFFNDNFLIKMINLVYLTKFLHSHKIKNISNFYEINKNSIENEILLLTKIVENTEKKNKLKQDRSEIWNNISFFDENNVADIYNVLEKNRHNPFRVFSKTWRKYKNFFSDSNLKDKSKKSSQLMYVEAKFFLDIKNYQVEIESLLKESNIIFENKKLENFLSLIEELKNIDKYKK